MSTPPPDKSSYRKLEFCTDSTTTAKSTVSESTRIHAAVVKLRFDRKTSGRRFGDFCTTWILMLAIRKRKTKRKIPARTEVMQKLVPQRKSYIVVDSSLVFLNDVSE
jgi:hypothetical protein